MEILNEHRSPELLKCLFAIVSIQWVYSDMLCNLSFSVLRVRVLSLRAKYEHNEKKTLKIEVYLRERTFYTSISCSLHNIPKRYLSEVT